MIIETYLYNKVNDINKKRKCNVKKINYIVFIITKLLITSISLFFAIKCNQNKSFYIKALFILIAFLFSDVYLLYIIFYYLILGKKC